MPSHASLSIRMHSRLIYWEMPRQGNVGLVLGVWPRNMKTCATRRVKTRMCYANSPHVYRRRKLENVMFPKVLLRTGKNLSSRSRGQVRRTQVDMRLGTSLRQYMVEILSPAVTYHLSGACFAQDLVVGSSKSKGYGNLLQRSGQFF